MKSTFASCFALIGTTAMALGIGVSHAKAVTPDFKVPTWIVHYQDLDLSQPRDAQRLYQRIQVAAKLVCDGSLPQSLATRGPQKACIERAVTEAVRQVGSVRVEQIHEAAMQRESHRG